jgi:low affinity Fe/Cu permease
MEEHDPYFFFENVTTWIGSVQSLFVHTLAFILCGVIGYLRIADWNTILLVLTTAVSLEAIYLAIFIQMTVNHHSEELEEVSEDIDEIQEDIDEIQEDVDEMQEDVEDIQEVDIKDAERRAKQMVTLEQLTEDVQRVLKDLESFKNGTPKTPRRVAKPARKKPAKPISSADRASRAVS